MVIIHKVFSLLLIVSFVLVGTYAVQPTNAQTIFIQDGDLIRATGTVDIYIVKIVQNKQFKRLILNPTIFESYGHLRWENVKDVSQATLNQYTTSNLVIEVYPNLEPVSGNVYALFPEGDVGVKRLVVGGSYDNNSVYYINHIEAGEGFYRTGQPITLSGSGTTQTQITQPTNIPPPPTQPDPQPTQEQPNQRRVDTHTNPDGSYEKLYTGDDGRLDYIDSYSADGVKKYTYHKRTRKAQEAGRSITQYYDSNGYIIQPIALPEPTDADDRAYLVKNIIARNTKQECSTNLLGIGDIIGNLAVPQYLCIRYGDPNRNYWAGGLYSDGFVFVVGETVSYRNTLVHELCHAWQDHYLSVTDRGYIGGRNFSFDNSSAGKEFIKILGFVRETHYNTTEWFLPQNSPYLGVYSQHRLRQTPTEMSAEICMLFIMGHHDGNGNDGYYAAFNNPKIRQWFEKYVVNIADIPVLPEAQDPRIIVEFDENGVLTDKHYFTDDFRWERSETFCRGSSSMICGLAYYYPNSDQVSQKQFTVYYHNTTTPRKITYRRNDRPNSWERMEYYDRDGNKTKTEYYDDDFNIIRTENH